MLFQEHSTLGVQSGKGLRTVHQVRVRGSAGCQARSSQGQVGSQELMSLCSLRRQCKSNTLQQRRATERQSFDDVASLLCTCDERPSMKSPAFTAPTDVVLSSAAAGALCLLRRLCTRRRPAPRKYLASTVVIVQPSSAAAAASRSAPSTPGKKAGHGTTELPGYRCVPRPCVRSFTT